MDRYSQGDPASSTINLALGGSQSGWIGERSMPKTLALGNWPPISITQMPVPVPMSRICREFSPMGAKNNFWPRLVCQPSFTLALFTVGTALAVNRILSPGCSWTHSIGANFWYGPFIGVAGCASSATVVSATTINCISGCVETVASHTVAICFA